MLDVSGAPGVEGVDSVSVFPERAALVFSHIYVSIYACVCTGPRRGLHIEGNRITQASSSAETGAYLVKAVVLSRPLNPG